MEFFAPVDEDPNFEGIKNLYGEKMEVWFV